MSTYHIVADDRERAVIPYLEAEGIDLNIQRITTGDYSIIYENGKMIIIERKSWADLAASIKDNRMRNTADLHRASRETGAKCAYIIEGMVPNRTSTRINGIPFHNLQSKVDHLMMRDDMHIIMTADPRATARRIVQLAKNCSTLRMFQSVNGGDSDLKQPTPTSTSAAMPQPNHSNSPDPRSMSGRPTGFERRHPSAQPVTYRPTQTQLEATKFLKSKKPGPPRISVATDMLCKLPGIAEHTAESILRFYDISQVVARLTNAQIEIIRHPNGKSLTKKATSSLANIERFYPSMMSVITGVTIKAATRINATYPLWRIAVGEVDAAMIANIEYTGSRQIRRSVADKVVDYYHTQYTQLLTKTNAEAKIEPTQPLDIPTPTTQHAGSSIDARICEPAGNATGDAKACEPTGDAKACEPTGDTGDVDSADSGHAEDSADTKLATTVADQPTVSCNESN